MKTMHWFLLAALAAPAAAAPPTLTPKEITSADRSATRLSVNLRDEELQTLARFGELRNLTLTGPYDG